MASYSMQLREYIESWSQDNDTMSTKDRIETGRTKLFDFDYPLFTPDYKKDFETKFIRNFYFTEIGFETEASFKFHLETWLDINMPFFNNLFKSELITFDPLTNTKLTTTENKTSDKTKNDTRDVTQNSSTTGRSNSTTGQTSTTDATTGNDATENVTDSRFNRQLEMDTPESRLSITPNADGSGTIEYASKITEDKETDTRDVTKHSDATNHSTTTDSGTNDTKASSDSSGTVTDTLSSTEHGTEQDTNVKTGKIGEQSYSKMLQEYRETFLRIEKQMFEEMREKLFMVVY